MKKERKIQFQRRHRVLSWLFAMAFFLLTTVSFQVVYADEVTTTGSSEAATEKSTADDVKDVTTNILKDEHGRIVFWEWKKVTTSNYMDLFKRGETHFQDGTFYPSLLVMHDSNMNPTGFISTYADKEHIFYGPKELTEGAEFDRLGNGDQAKVDAIYKMLDEGSGLKGWKVTEAFNKDTSSYIVLDSDSRLLNEHKELFSQDSFITSGSSMGVPYLSPVNRGVHALLMGEPLKDYGIEVPRASMQIALARGSAKGNSGDMSYTSIGKNPTVQDHFLVTPLEAGDNRIVLKNKMEDLTTIIQGGRGSQDSDDNRDWVPKDNESSSQHFMGEKVDYSRDITFFGMYAYKGEKDTDKWIILSDDGYSFLAVKNGYLLNLGVGILGNMFDGALTPKEATSKMVKNYLSATDPAFCHVFSWYIGEPHVFAAIKGVGGDPESGVGGTTTVGKGDALLLRDTSYIDANGNSVLSEGVVLPEGSSIVIEEGGVLSVQGNFINNGKIINKGGTIIIKDGGCISPYGITKEGTIQCCSSASGLAGSVIIMPGGKLFSLVDDSKLDVKEKNLAMARVMKGGTRQEEPALLMTGGSSLINYGLFVTNMTRLDNTGRIENRKNGSAFLGYNRDSTNVLLYKCNEYNKVSVEHIIRIRDQNRRDNSGILATEIYKNQDFNYTAEILKGTLYEESTSNLQLSMPITSLLKRANHVVPEY